MIDKLKKITDLFTRHPSEYGKNYFTHMLLSLGYALMLMKAGLFCIVHAFFPFLFMRAASSTAAKILATTEKKERWK